MRKRMKRALGMGMGMEVAVHLDLFLRNNNLTEAVKREKMYHCVGKIQGLLGYIELFQPPSL